MARAEGAYELRVSAGVGTTCPATDLGPITLDQPGVFRQEEWSSSDCRSDRQETRGKPSDAYTFEVREESPGVREATSVTVIVTTATEGVWVWLLDDNDNNLVNQHTGQPASARGIPGGVEITARSLPAGTYTLEVTTTATASGGHGAYQLRVAREVPFGEEVEGPCSEEGESAWADADGSWTDEQDVHTVKELLVRVLFQIPAGRDPVRCTYADYNDFAQNPGLFNEGYAGGHAGWDVQTVNVARERTANVPFYSLTAGKVAYVVAPDGELRGGTVAVFDHQAQKTTYYLHARHVYVHEEQQVSVGQRLGIQGNNELDQTDRTVREHVHVEVHEGARLNPMGERQHRLIGTDSDTVLRWHAQLNYLCRESASSWLRRGGISCYDHELTEQNAPDGPSPPSP